ncbi:LysR family transcriptional regulator [Clostridium beijerinckii]|uniref:LysR family transcriptional regulator n=1 Tax=Clostridium beijerinckii TaxID=1520 RepID=UPI0030FE17A3
MAKCKNISRAAEILFVSQPAVSKSIKTLETSFNVTLFSRSSKGVTLTPEGKILFDHIKMLLMNLTLERIFWKS